MTRKNELGSNELGEPIVKRWILTGAALVLGLSANFALAQSPNAVIEEAVSMLTERLGGKKDQFAKDRAALYQLIDDILLPRFDRRFAAQLVLARHWRSATDEHRQRFIDAFYASLLKRYADGVLEFEEDRIEVLAFRGDVSKKTAPVRTIVELDDGSKVPVNYDLVRRGDQWKIFNVTIEGVSFMKNYRAELDAEIRSSSLVAVIERLEAEATKAAAVRVSETDE